MGIDSVLTVRDVAGILKVKEITVREMFREKRLRGFKMGKAWRTTERILQEDIEALAQGQSPADLPAVGGPSTTKRSRAVAKKPPKKKAPAAAPPPPPEASAVEEPVAEEPAMAEPGGDEATETDQHRKSKAKPKKDDSQQLLF